MKNVFHLAAMADIVPSIENHDDNYRTYVTGTYNVLKASINNKVKRFIYSASSSCYGIPNEFPTKETSEISPQYPYALSKRLGEYGFKVEMLSFPLYSTVIGKEIKKIGLYEAKINLHAEIQAKIHIEGVKEEAKV